MFEKKKVNPQIIMDFVSNKGGKALNLEIYKSNLTKLLFECEFGHRWEASWANVGRKNNARWCPTCSKNKKLTLEFAKNIAIERKATLVSSEYVNSATKLDWICCNGHSFSMKINAINSRGQWCPYCSVWSSEEICRFYFEKLFNMKFTKIRPSWLVNDRGNKMELDGISENFFDGYKIAFEHHGEQHYSKDANITNANYYYNFSLDQRKKDDLDKKILCLKNNVFLIEIPQLYKRTKLENLISLIEKECNNFGIKLQPNFSKTLIDINELYVMPREKSIQLDQIIEIVENKGGKCLSDHYINSTAKLKIQCKYDHIFFASSNAIKNGRWCSTCSKRKRLTIEDMQYIAISRNGKCLSENYFNAKSKLKWFCNVCSYIWESTGGSVKNSKTWCPNCNGGVKKENKC